MSNPVREIAKMMDKRSRQNNKTVYISEGGGTPSTSGSDHNHDERYYKKNEVDNKLAGKSSVTHNHDEEYSDIDHNHALESITDFPSYVANAGKVLAVKETEDGVEFIEMSSGSYTAGVIDYGLITESAGSSLDQDWGDLS